MKTILLSILITLSFSICCHAHIGKVAYANPLTSILIDGNNDEWPKDLIDFGNTAFELAYNKEQQLLYFYIEVQDDDYTFDENQNWFNTDNIALYLNPIHAQSAPTCMMAILNEKGVQLIQADTAHQLLNTSDIQFKMKRTTSTRIYEGSIFLSNFIQDYRTIGFDLMTVNEYSNPEFLKEFNNWGSGQFMEYRSGQLGDIVLLPNQQGNFGELTGKIQWETSSQEPLPDIIKITSMDHADFWIMTSVERTGDFKITLPAGNYQIASAYKISAPFKDNGYDNQHRIDDTYYLSAEIKANEQTTIPDFFIPTFKFPSYLLSEEGILHQYDESKEELINQFVRIVCNYYNIPGASIALIKDNKVVYHHQFGVENLLTQQAVVDTTLFQAASVTKSVFAFIVLRLVEKGVLDLDRPLHEYLVFENIADDERSKKITARWVLSHQSGLPNWAFGGPGGAKHGQKQELLFEPGTKYGYSGEAFEYLGRVVVHLTGKDLDQLLQEEVINALNIPPLYFKDDGSLHQARGHYADGRPTYFGTPSEAGVAHSMLTEAYAFAQFVCALSRKKGLSPNMYQQLQKRLVLAEGFESPENLYWNLGVSLGFFVQDTPFGKAILHGGNNGDFQAEFVLYTEKNMGFVVFTNANTGHKLGQHLGKFLMYGKKTRPIKDINE